MSTSDVTKSCVFLKVTLSRLGDKRGVSSEEFEVEANKEFVKARKIIFKSASFDAIRSLDGEIRRYVRDIALPFDPGIHLVPKKMTQQIETRLQEYMTRRHELVEVFSRIYPTLKKDVQKDLRKLYNEKDYEDDGDVKDEFYMNWQFLMFTVPDEVGYFDPETYQREKDKWSERLEQAYNETKQVLRETALELVHHLRDKLENDAYGAPKRLSASAITHLLEFTENYRKFYHDVTNDTQLNEYLTSVQRVLRGVDPDALRELGGIRTRVHNELQGVEEAINASLIIAPKRRIKVA